MNNTWNLTNVKPLMPRKVALDLTFVRFLIGFNQAAQWWLSLWNTSLHVTGIWVTWDKNIHHYSVKQCHAKLPSETLFHGILDIASTAYVLKATRQSCPYWYIFLGVVAKEPLATYSLTRTVTLIKSDKWLCRTRIFSIFLYSSCLRYISNLNKYSNPIDIK